MRCDAFIKGMTILSTRHSRCRHHPSLQAKDDMEANIEALKLESKALRDMQLSSGEYAICICQTVHVTVAMVQC